MRSALTTRTDRQSAFSLVELSIVLVILGLLVGGVLAGQSLIRASQLRAFTTQYTQYITAVQSFKDKYFYLPGDMPNATSFWGVAATPAATCYNTVSTDTKTCDGNGDGTITGSSDEEERFWQHLANAGLIPGQYGGNYGVNSPANQPVGKIGGLWITRDQGTVTMPGNMMFNGYYGNTFSIEGIDWNDFLKPEELWNMDTKIDDGKPGTGKIVGYSHKNIGMGLINLATCTTATSGTQITADYLLSDTNLDCSVWFRTIF